MPTLTEAIRVQMVMDTDGIRRGMKQATGAVRVGTKNMSGRFNILKGSIVGVAGALGGLIVAQKAAKFFFNVNREAEKLRASLVTVTGSAELAKQAFAGIEAFAGSTPFQIEEIAQAFIKLGALGLEPSERALRSYGNTASAMGKSLNQFIEAVADASTMEFERLKEFGIKARQQADSVSFTFQGVTTTVGKNAEEITAFLQSIGENKFGDAMAVQMNTLNGVISNIQDSLSTLARIMGEEGGVNNELRNMLMAVRDFLAELTTKRDVIVSWTNTLVLGLKLGISTLQNFIGQLKNIGEIIIGGPVSAIWEFGKALSEGKGIIESFGIAGDAAMESIKTDFNDAIILQENMKEAQRRFIESLKETVTRTQNWDNETVKVKGSLDAVAEAMKQVKEETPEIVLDMDKINLEHEEWLINLLKAKHEAGNIKKPLSEVQQTGQMVAEDAARWAASLIKGEMSLKSIGKNLLKAGIGIGSQFIPGGGIVSSFLGGLFKTGSAGRIAAGPVKMAKSGMEIGNIGTRTQIIGVHKNEGVANERFMDNFERRFGAGAFRQANATGDLPGGDSYTFNISGGMGGMSQADIERMFITAHRSAKRKLMI